jgi:hypothetical protein
MKPRWNAVSVLAAMFACLAVLGLSPADWTILRALAAVPFLFLLPGMSILLIIDPECRLAGFEWFTLAASSSVAVVVLTNVGLAAFGLLGAQGTVLVLASAITVTCVASMLGLGDTGDRLVPSIASMLGLRDAARGLIPSRRSPLRRGAIAAACLLTVAAIVIGLSRDELRPSPSAQVVMLWGLPDGSGGLTIGAQNVDASSKAYRLTISQQGRQISEQSLDLATGTRRVFVVKASATLTKNAPVEAQLVDLSGKVATRTVSVWTTE